MAWRQASSGWKAGWILGALACLILLTSMLRAIVDHRDPKPLAVLPVPPVTAQDHSPGAALPYASTPSPTVVPQRLELAAPAPGSTGTVAPPPVPAGSAGMAETSTGIVAARPFDLGHAAALDRGRALECLTAAVYHEAGNQSDDGERAVAQVILNRVRHPAFPSTVCGVVYQGSEHAGCQFSFACDGSMARPTSRTGWNRALRIASDGLAGTVFAPVGLATHYHTYAVTPAWNRALVMTDAVGAHFFHRWKGYWGTAAAFHQTWSEHEPAPGPHLRFPDPVIQALPAPPSVPVIASAGPAANMAAPTIQPAHAESGTSKTADPPPAQSLPSSSVLDRWKDSGTPLR